MTAEIVNLRLARKRQARTRAEDQAAVRRADFGRSKALKTLARTEQALSETRLDGHRLAPATDRDAP